MRALGEAMVNGFVLFIMLCMAGMVILAVAGMAKAAWDHPLWAMVVAGVILAFIGAGEVLRRKGM